MLVYMLCSAAREGGKDLRKEAEAEASGGEGELFPMQNLESV